MKWTYHSTRYTCPPTTAHGEPLKYRTDAAKDKNPAAVPQFYFHLRRRLKSLNSCLLFYVHFQLFLIPVVMTREEHHLDLTQWRFWSISCAVPLKKVLQRWQRSALLPLFLCSRLLPLFSPRFHLPSCSVSLSLSSSIMDEAHWSQCDSLWKIPNISRKGWHVIANASGHVSTDHLCKTYSFWNFFPLIMHLTFHPFI